jgi:hypothetical protein
MIAHLHLLSRLYGGAEGFEDFDCTCIYLHKTAGLLWRPIGSGKKPGNIVPGGCAERGATRWIVTHGRRSSETAA